MLISTCLFILLSFLLNFVKGQAGAPMTTQINPEIYRASGNFFKSSPSFIQELDRVNAPCFNNLRPILGYFSDFEQAVIAKAALANQDPTRCLNCTVYVEEIGPGLDAAMTELTRSLSDTRANKRSNMTCLVNFARSMGLDNAISGNITNQLLTYFYTQKVSSECLARFVADLSNMLLFRRRFLCARIDDMEQMVIRDTRNNTIGFKWNEGEARNLTHSFIQLSTCNSLQVYSYPQVVVDSIATMTYDPKCSRNIMRPTDEITHNVTIPEPIVVIVPNTTTNSSVPSGRLLLEDTLRFLQTIPGIPGAGDIGTTEPAPTIMPTTTPVVTTTTVIPGIVDVSPPEVTPTPIAPTTEVVPPPTITPTTEVVPPPTITPPITTTKPTLTTTTPTATTTELSIDTTAPIVVETEVAIGDTITPTTITPEPTIPTDVTSPTNETIAIIPPLIPILGTNETQPTLEPQPIVKITEPRDATDAIFQPKPNQILVGAPILMKNKFLLTDTPNKNVLISNILNFAGSDRDIFDSFSSAIGNAQNKNQESHLFTKASEIMSFKLIDNYQFRCMPELWTIFLTNVQESLGMLDEFNPNAMCTQDSVIIIQNGNIQCTNCVQADKTVAFSTLVHNPREYELVSLCLDRSRVVFAHIVDEAGIPYLDYAQRNIHLGQRCLRKAIDCAGNTPNSPDCPKNLLSSDCLAGLNNNCTDTGLFNRIDRMQETQIGALPRQCDYIQLRLPRNSSQFYLSCFTWINRNLLINDLLLNNTALSNLDYLNSSRRTRLLQTVDTAILAENDPTLTDLVAMTVKEIRTNNTVIVIDGVRPYHNVTRENVLGARTEIERTTVPTEVRREPTLVEIIPMRSESEVLTMTIFFIIGAIFVLI